MSECAKDELISKEALNIGQIEGRDKVTFDDKAICRNVLKIESLEGDFIKGQPNGPIKLSFLDGSFAKANFKHGVLHGLYVGYWCKFGPCDLLELEAWRKPRHLREISVYHKGQRVGASFEFKIGGGFVAGLVDQQGQLTGPKLSYVYPDLETMLVGQFDKGQLVSGLQAELLDLEPSENGLKLPTHKFKGQKRPFKLSISTKNSMGADPLLRDPMEDKYLFVSNSTLANAGRGIFMKIKANKGQTVGFYNGVRMPDLESKIRLEDRKSPYRMDNDWATPKEILNIPEEFRSEDKYNATLGHLINHSQTPNCWYAMIDHPRFGKIRSIVLLQDVEANDELFVDYGYVEQYAQSETAIKTIYEVSKFLSGKNDEDFHADMKYQIKYLKKKVEDYKPYIEMFKNVANLIK